jgi:hypothetical protein
VTVRHDVGEDEGFGSVLSVADGVGDGDFVLFFVAVGLGDAEEDGSAELVPVLP